MYYFEYRNERIGSIFLYKNTFHQIEGLEKNIRYEITLIYGSCELDEVKFLSFHNLQLNIPMNSGNRQKFFEIESLDQLYTPTIVFQNERKEKINVDEYRLVFCLRELI